MMKLLIKIVKRPSSNKKFIYSEKATKFCEISTIDLSYVVPTVAFSEYMKFKKSQFSFLK